MLRHATAVTELSIGMGQHSRCPRTNTVLKHGHLLNFASPLLDCPAKKKECGLVKEASGLFPSRAKTRWVGQCYRPHTLPVSIGVTWTLSTFWSRTKAARSGGGKLPMITSSFLPRHFQATVWKCRLRLPITGFQMQSPRLGCCNQMRRCQ